MLLSLVIAVAASILAVFFANYNPHVVDLSLFGYPVHGSVGVIIVIAVGAGALLGLLMMLPTLLSRSWALIRARRKIEDLQNAMRSAPVQDVPQG